MISTIDWSSPQIVAACITGGVALVAALLAWYTSRKKSSDKGDNQAQTALFSKDVQQIQAKGDVNIGVPQDPPQRKPGGRKPTK